jgi:hypothetical protein
MMLTTEIDYYNANRHKLREQYKDQYIVVVGRQVIGAFPSHKDAYTEAVKEYELGTFLICNTALSHRL